MTRIEKVFKMYPMFEDIVSINKMIRATCPGDFLPGEPTSHGLLSIYSTVEICYAPNCIACWKQEVYDDTN